MDAFEPLINLLVLLTALSVASERLTNVWKLNNSVLRLQRRAKDDEKDRERQIAWRSLVVGVVVAVLLKADLFAVLSRLDAPWETLGWIQSRGSLWIFAPEARNGLTAFHAVAGSVVTGAALGFGSKFWHEILDTVLELRKAAKGRNDTQNGSGGNDGDGH